MASTSTKIGHGLAKVLGIKLDPYHQKEAEKITRGESVFSVSSADTFVEEEPTVGEWLSDTTPSMHDLAVYARNIFPFTHWITRYNLQWLYGDLVAGITIGAVVVPQGMAYAQLAEVPVEYGLYTSFMGVLIYWFFATSKDITIGVSSITIPFERAIHSHITSPSQSCLRLSETLFSPLPRPTPRSKVMSLHPPSPSCAERSLRSSASLVSVGSSTSSHLPRSLLSSVALLSVSR